MKEGSFRNERGGGLSRGPWRKVSSFQEKKGGTTWKILREGKKNNPSFRTNKGGAGDLAKKRGLKKDERKLYLRLGRTKKSMAKKPAREGKGRQKR